MFLIHLKDLILLTGVKVKISACSKDGNWEINADSAVSDRRSILTNKPLVLLDGENAILHWPKLSE